jgi:hypothetical protein
VWRLASDPLVQQIQANPSVPVLVPDDNGASDSLAGIERSGQA